MGEVSRNVLRRTFFSVADSTFLSLPFLLCVYFVSCARLCSSKRLCAPAFSSAVFHREIEQGGDSDREIVGIRGVTRGDLVLVHGSIRLRSSSQLRSAETRKILPSRILIGIRNFPYNLSQI